MSAGRFDLRPARPDDAADLARLEAAAFEAATNRPWSEDELRAEIAAGPDPSAVHRRVLVAEAAGGELLGHAVWRAVAGEGELLRIASLPRARRRGVARALLAAGLAALAEPPIEARVCRLEVRADNRGAIALYAGFGFALDGRRRAYYPDGVDALLMTRSFHPSENPPA